LKKFGLRAYILFGVAKTVVIERESPRRFRVKPASMPVPFYYEEFPLLRDARVYAEELAGVKRQFDGVRDLPKCLDRRVRRK
jgi:hypothetical protein